MIPKIKRTKNGNIQITITEEQSLAVRDLFKFTGFNGRNTLCKNYGCKWTEELDQDYKAVYDLIMYNLGEK